MFAGLAALIILYKSPEYNTLVEGFWLIKDCIVPKVLSVYDGGSITNSILSARVLAGLADKS